MAVPGIENRLQAIRNRIRDVPTEYSSHTIFRFPSFPVHGVRRPLYQPSLVSIGPFHREDDDLRPMQELKERYLSSLMSRRGDPEQLRNSCTNEILRQHEKIRACYAERINLENDDLARILLVDGCFLVELLLKNIQPPEIGRGDPIFSCAVRLNDLKRDLVLLENQIPFFVLKKLFSLTVDDTNPLADLKILLLQLYRRELNLEDEEAFDVGCIKPHHLLDFIRHCHIARFQPRSISSPHDWRCTRSAKALGKAGIQFEKSPSKNLLVLEFSKSSGKFKIPQLLVHGWTESLFWNLVALEQCRYHHRESYITSYIFLLDRLINTDEDVIFLKKKQILKGDTANAGVVARLFKSIGAPGLLTDFHFGELCGDLEKYRGRLWHRIRSIIKRVTNSSMHKEA